METKSSFQVDKKGVICQMINMIGLLQNILFEKMRILVFALAESLADIKKIYFGF